MEHNAFILLECLEVCFDKVDMDRVIVVPWYGEPILGVGLLYPVTHQFYNLRSMLSLIVATFPTILVIYEVGILLCRCSCIVILIAWSICWYGGIVLPNLVEPFRWRISSFRYSFAVTSSQLHEPHILSMISFSAIAVSIKIVIWNRVLSGYRSPDRSTNNCRHSQRIVSHLPMSS